MAYTLFSGILRTVPAAVAATATSTDPATTVTPPPDDNNNNNSNNNNHFSDGVNSPENQGDVQLLVKQQAEENEEEEVSTEVEEEDDEDEADDNNVNKNVHFEEELQAAADTQNLHSCGSPYDRPAREVLQEIFDRVKQQHQARQAKRSQRRRRIVVCSGKSNLVSLSRQATTTATAAAAAAAVVAPANDDDNNNNNETGSNMPPQQEQEQQQQQNQQQSQNQQQPAPVAPKRKKITRLIPADESLPAIEEGTERSEDSMSITVAVNASSSSSSLAQQQQQQRALDHAARSSAQQRSKSESGIIGSIHHKIVKQRGTTSSPPMTKSIKKNKPRQSQSQAQLSGEPSSSSSSSIPEASSTGTEKTSADEDDDSVVLDSSSTSPRSPQQQAVSSSLTEQSLSSQTRPPQEHRQQQQQAASETESETVLNSPQSPPSCHPPLPPANHSALPSTPPPSSSSQPVQQQQQQQPSPESATGTESAAAASPPPPPPPTGPSSSGSLVKTPPPVRPSDKSSGRRTSPPSRDHHKGGERVVPHTTTTTTTTQPLFVSESTTTTPSQVEEDDVDQELFNFDDDYESEEEQDKEEALTWRLDPSLSLSDWTIIVQYKNSSPKMMDDDDSSTTTTGHAETYYVHKNILAVGPKKCEYFVQVFRTAAKNGSLGVHGNQVTEVTLEAVAADVFPLFLDYLYEALPTTAGTHEPAKAMEDGAAKMTITTSNAAGLRYLASFFGVRMLHKKVMEFIQRDVSLSTIPIYYKNVMILRDEKMLQTLAKYCAKHILNVDAPSSLILQVAHVHFMKMILSAAEIDTREKKLHASILVAQYCHIHVKDLSKADFQVLTDEKLLSVIHPNVALTLLELEAEIVVAKSLASMMEMSSLQARCIKIVTSHWARDPRTDIDIERITRIGRKLPSSIVTELLVKALAAQQQTSSSHSGSHRRRSSSVERERMSDVPTVTTVDATGEGNAIFNTTHAGISNSGHSLGSAGKHPKERGVKRSDSSTSSKSVNKDKREFEAKMEKMKQDHVETLALLKREYEANLVKLRDMLLEKDKQIALYWQEIKNFQRLANSYDGKLQQTNKQHQATVVPEHATGSDDAGYLLVNKKNGSKLPIYYYNKENPSSCSKEEAKSEKGESPRIP